MNDQMRFTILQEIDITQITILQSLSNKSSQVKCWYLMRRENWSTRAEKRTNKLNPHMTPGAEIEPEPHCKASAPNTRPDFIDDEFK